MQMCQPLRMAMIPVSHSLLSNVQQQPSVQWVWLGSEEVTSRLMNKAVTILGYNRLQVWGSDMHPGSHTLANR